jgi:hypothetical protein
MMMMGTRTEEDRKPECSVVGVGRPGENRSTVPLEDGGAETHSVNGASRLMLSLNCNLFCES